MDDQTSTFGLFETVIPWWRAIGGVLIAAVGAASGFYFLWGQFETTIGRGSFVVSVLLVFGIVTILAVGQQRVDALRSEIEDQDWKTKSEAAEGFLSTESNTFKRNITFVEVEKYLNLEDPEHATWTETYRGRNESETPLTEFYTKLVSEDIIDTVTVMFKHEDQPKPVELPSSDIVDVAEKVPHKSTYKIQFPDEYPAKNREEFELEIITSIGYYNLEVGNYNRFEFNTFDNQVLTARCKLKLSQFKSEQLRQEGAGISCKKYVGRSGVNMGRDLAAVELTREEDLTAELQDSERSVDDGVIYEISDTNVKDIVYVIKMIWPH